MVLEDTGSAYTDVSSEVFCIGPSMHTHVPAYTCSLYVYTRIGVGTVGGGRQWEGGGSFEKLLL